MHRFRFEAIFVATLVLTVSSSSAVLASNVFPTRDEALARGSLVVESGTISGQYRVASPSPDATYDLRGLTSTAYPSATTYPFSFGSSTPGTGTVVVGGTVLGSTDLATTWQDMKANFDGSALLMFGLGQIASYDLRADDVFDMFRPRPPGGDLSGATFLIDGCYGTNIRDDAIENDQEMTGTIRNCVFDGINSGVSIGQNATNPAAVTTIEDTTFIFRPFPNLKAADGVGHAVLFKQMGGGQVVMRNDLVCYSETPIGPERLTNWMPGTYENVTVVLGPAFDGDADGDLTDLDHPGTLPPGVSQTRDWTLCDPNASVPPTPSPSPSPDPSPPPAPSPPPPEVAGMTPTSATVGTAVTITGSGFTDATSVSFNGTPAAFTVDSDTQITAIVPAGATNGAIAIGGPGGAGSSSSTFTVMPPPPAITGMTPATAMVGSSVTISGSGFTDATKVWFGGTSASFSVDSDTQITAVVPQGATTGPMSIDGPGGSGLSPSEFTVTPPPAITGMSPMLGTVGTSVTITGSGFTDASAVRINGTNATFIVNSDAQLTAVVPQGATTGPVTVTGPSGAGTSLTNFIVTATLTFAPTADTYVASGSPSKNFGNATTLQLGQNPRKDVLLKFTLSGVGSRTVLSARLRLYCVRGSTSGGIFFPTPTSTWGEKTVTWKNAPPAGATSVASLGPVAANTWYEVDLSSFVRAGGTYSLRVPSSSITEAQYTPREGKTTSLRPKLIVVVG